MADAAEHLSAQVQVMMTQMADLRVDVRALGSLSGDVRELTGRVDTQLSHGSRKMDDMQKDIDDLAGRLGKVEAAEQRRTGRVSVLQLIVSVALTLAGSSTAAAIATYLLTRH